MADRFASGTLSRASQRNSMCVNIILPVGIVLPDCSQLRRNRSRIEAVFFVIISVSFSAQ